MHHLEALAPTSRRLPAPRRAPSGRTFASERRSSLAITALLTAGAITMFGSSALADDAAPPSGGSKESAPSAKDSKDGKDTKDSKDAKGGKRKSTVDPERIAKMQIKLDKEDREAIDRNLNYTLSEPPGEVEWVGTAPMSVQTLRGRVVVIQSLSTRSGNWKGTLDALRRQFREYETDQPVLVLLHTPDGAERAKAALEPALDGAMAVVDPEGVWCDDLGVWKRPVNLVVDRNGVVRYAGLTPEGVGAAVDLLRAEDADPNAENKPRPAATAEESRFPTFRDAIGAADRRGSKVPGFVVDSWVNGTPDRGDRLLVLDFWATWCGPCRAMIPHMNELAQKYSADACVVGISDESKSNFEEGFRKHKLKERDFRYALGLDPQARLKGFFAPKGIPHCAIVSSDDIVRWQGHPSQLTDDLMRTLVQANRALTSGASGPSAGGKWKASSNRGGGGGNSRAPARKRY